jgi:hypothetical protein
MVPPFTVLDVDIGEVLSMEKTDKDPEEVTEQPRTKMKVAEALMEELVGHRMELAALCMAITTCRTFRWVLEEVAVVVKTVVTVVQE